jgi:putative membrane protein
MAEFLVLLVAVAAWVLCRVFPAETPFLLPYVFNPVEFAGFWLVLVWYLRGGGRSVWFLAGWAVGYFVLQTHFEYLAQHLFCLNRVQAVVLGMVTPFGVALGRPAAALAKGAPAPVVRAAGAMWARTSGLAQPLVVALLFLASTDVWLIPPVHFAAMLNPGLYGVMNLSCLLGGLLFWLVVMDPRPKPPCRLSYVARAGLGFIVMFPQMPISAYIALCGRDLYAFYTLCGRLFPGMSPQYDQLLGGIIQWIPPGMMNTAALVICLVALRREEDAAPPPPIPEGAKVYEAKWTGRG